MLVTAKFADGQNRAAVYDASDRVAIYVSVRHWEDLKSETDRYDLAAITQSARDYAAENFPLFVLTESKLDENLMYSVSMTGKLPRLMGNVWHVDYTTTSEVQLPEYAACHLELSHRYGTRCTPEDTCNLVVRETETFCEVKELP